MNKQNLLKIKKSLLMTSLLLCSSLTPFNMHKVNAQTVNKEVSDNRLYDKDEMISYYCKVFSLKEDIVKVKLYELTDDFHSPGWQNSYCINNSFYDTMEYALLSTIRDIYNNPEDYDLDDSIRTDEIYEPDMEIEEMIYKYSNIYGINKEVALSIVYCECGTDVNSYNYLNNNNPAGIGPNMHFLNKEVGVIYFCNMLKNNYNCNEDSNESFLNSIASTYCEIPAHWLDLTLPSYYNLKDDYLFYVNENDKKDYDIESYEEKSLKLK